MYETILNVQPLGVVFFTNSKFPKRQKENILVTESKSDRKKGIEKTMMVIPNQDVSKLPDNPDRALLKKNFETMQPTISLGITRTDAQSRSCSLITNFKNLCLGNKIVGVKGLKYDSPSTSPQSLNAVVGCSRHSVFFRVC